MKTRGHIEARSADPSQPARHCIIKINNHNNNFFFFGRRKRAIVDRILGQEMIDAHTYMHALGVYLFSYYTYAYMRGCQLKPVAAAVTAVAQKSTN